MFTLCLWDAGRVYRSGGYRFKSCQAHQRINNFGIPRLYSSLVVVLVKVVVNKLPQFTRSALEAATSLKILILDCLV